MLACTTLAGRRWRQLFNHLADPARAGAVSAGTRPAERVHPEVAEAMREVGIDLASARPQRLTEQLATGATLLVTMGCGDECPVVPGMRRDDWPLDDPKGKPPERVRAIRDENREREGWERTLIEPFLTKGLPRAWMNACNSRWTRDTPASEPW